MIARIGIVAAYTVVFWIALPVGLWQAATVIDGVSPVGLDPIPGAFLILGAGAGLMAWAIAALWTRGGGLPVSALPPPRLVCTGPYRLSRHPIYLGFNLALLGAALVSGSIGLLLLSALFVPVWVSYARWEERGLVARFGESYRRVQRQVGWLPRWGLYRVAQVLMALRMIPTRVSGREHLPRTGGYVLVANHTCYLDPCFVGVVTPRLVHFTTTAEAYRGGLTELLVRRTGTVPVRRYRQGCTAAREVLRLLAEGEVVAMFPEGERSPLGDYQGAMPDVASILARLPVPVIPVVIRGAYDVGPRWAGALRRRLVTITVGPALRFDERAPTDVCPDRVCPDQIIDTAMRQMLTDAPEPVHLAGLPLARLERVLWACPACAAEDGWRAELLRCDACGATWRPRPDGFFDGPQGIVSFAAIGRQLWARPEAGGLSVEASGAVERSPYGEPVALQPLGTGRLCIDREGLTWNELHLPITALRSVSTERADILQVATRDGMWQFQVERGSVFRLKRALDAWRPAPPARPPRPPRFARPPSDSAPTAPVERWLVPTAGVAVGAGVLVTESAAVIRPLMDGFGAGGAIGPMAIALLSYCVIGGGADIGAQAIGLRSPWIRGGLAVAVGVGMTLASGQVPGAVALVFLGAILWALAAHGRWTWPLAVLVAAWACAPALPRPAVAQTASPSPALPQTPSVALIVLDTLRMDRTSLFRADGRDTTPNLLRLSQDGVLLERAWSTSCWSLPAHASLFTGLMPSRHGAHYEHLRLDEGAPTLAEQLADAGYATAGFSANPLIAPGTGLSRGFSTFAEPWRAYTLREALVAWRVATRVGAADRDKGGAEVLAELQRWLNERDTQRPFFVFVNLMEAHVPYQEVPVQWRRRWVDPTLSNAALEAIGERSHMAQVLGTSVPEEDRATTLDLLDGATAAVDDLLGQALTALRATGEPVLVVVLSDHGDLLGEHGLWGHNLGLWEPIVDVPIVVAGPGVLQGRVSDVPVSILDLFPTILSWVGVAPPPNDGVDLSAVLRGADDGARYHARVLRAEHFRTDFLTAGWQWMRPLADHAAIRARRAAARRGMLKRMIAEDGADESFNLATDPGEQRPFTDRTLELSLPVPGAATALPPMDPAQTEALRNLGYVR